VAHLPSKCETLIQTPVATVPLIKERKKKKKEKQMAQKQGKISCA
jgi:hypothetical protein